MDSRPSRSRWQLKMLLLAILAGSCWEENAGVGDFKPVPFLIEDLSLKISIIAPRGRLGNRSGDVSRQLLTTMSWAIQEISRAQDVKLFDVPYDVDKNYEAYKRFYEERPYENKTYAQAFVRDLHQEHGSNILIYGHFEFGSKGKLYLNVAIARENRIRGKSVALTNYSDASLLKREVLDFISRIISEEVS